MNPLDPKTSIDMIDAGLALVGRNRLDWPQIYLRNMARARPAALAHLLRSLRRRSDWSGNAVRRGVRAVKYLARSLWMPRLQTRFLAFVFGDAAMRALQRRDPRVVERHFHRFVNRRWNRSMRLRALVTHYRCMRAVMPAPLFHAVYADGGATLGEIELKDDSRLKLCLRPPIAYGCEGELTIQLCDAYELPLYRIVVTAIGGDRPTLAIGSIQGPGTDAGREAVRELTRKMHGLRPKDLMLALASAFARHVGIERMLAVSNAAHPLRGRRRGFVADYDAFWMEHGRVAGDGWFELPVGPLHKSVDEVPSHHRSAFRRREALRLHAERLLTDALATPASVMLGVERELALTVEMLRPCP